MAKLCITILFIDILDLILPIVSAYFRLILAAECGDHPV